MRSIPREKMPLREDAGENVDGDSDPETGDSGRLDDSNNRSGAEAPTDRVTRRRNVTWADGEGRDEERDSLVRADTDHCAVRTPFGTATTMTSEESSSRDRVSLLPEHMADLEEMRALLPTLRRVQSFLEARDGSILQRRESRGERGEATVVTSSAATTCRASVSLRISDGESGKSQAREDSETLEEEDDCAENGAPGYDRVRFIEHRSLGQSILQHVSKGIRAARRNSDSSSSCREDERAHSGATRQEYVKPSRDVYSLVYLCPPRSFAFFFALVTFVFQMFILVLIMVDIIEVDSSNPLQIPPGVSRVVRAAQVMCILISVATQDDLITAINELHVGYYRKALIGDGVHELGGTKWQWLLSVSTRFIQGGLCLAVTFILIMQSGDVVGLFLDFLAVTFVSTLDDIMFSLAKQGYFGPKTKGNTDAVCRIRVPKKAIRSRLFRPIVFFMVSAAMLLGWGIIAHEQKRGDFLSSKAVAVQFGDSFAASLGFFSGTYERIGLDKHNRPIYLEKTVAIGGGTQGKGMLAYCFELEAWTFSFPDSTASDADPCYWYAKSIETDTYDMMTLRPADWFVYGRRSKKAVPFQHFQIASIDCDQSDGRGSCNGIGRCVDNKCVCDPGRYGLSCEFGEPCQYISVDSEFGVFPGATKWAESYSILHHCNGNHPKVNVYNRPVYISDHGTESSIQVILFTGRRWALTTAEDLINGEEINLPARPLSKCSLAKAMTSFHAYWKLFDPSFISSPNDVGTPTDSATPIGNAWYQSNSYEKSANLNFPISTHLICKTCHEVRNPCRNNGICRNDGTCECSRGTYGALCQIKSFQLCRRVAVHMGDGFGKSLGSLSGTYELFGDDSINGRVVYVESHSHGAFFAYCEEENAWTFTILPNPLKTGSSLSNSTHTEFDPCKNWTAVSPDTDTYDITQVNANWLVRLDQTASHGIPFDFFLLWCSDCDQQKIPCNGAGICSNNGKCLCNDGRYGLSCEVQKSCTTIVADASREIFENILPSKYKILHGHSDEVLLYERPVYYSVMSRPSHANGENYAFIFFAGHRWHVVDTESIPALESGVKSTEELAEFISINFHGYFSSYTARFVSEPVIELSHSYAASPIYLRWYPADPFSNQPADSDQPLSVKLWCAFCNVKHPCYNDGVCLNSTCKCPLGMFGSHCLITSVCKSFSVALTGPSFTTVQAPSGVYDLSDVQTEYSDRPVYILRGDKNAMFAYCFEQVVWTYTFWNSTEKGVLDVDPCEDYVAKSSWSNGFDIMSAPTWFVRAHDGEEFAALMPTEFSSVCNDHYY
mmetsp:Transcript_8639/g.25926  ORF Transcript_8639/g.25926 Transcript_8639/m.25926 type:complete len:1292 (-) Transcript_8639:17-3892(-)